MTQETTPAARKPSFLFLAIVHLNFLAVVSIAPIVIPNLGREFNLEPFQIKLWTTGMILGLGLMAFASGALSTAFGNRLIGVLAAIALVAAYLASGLGQAYWLLLALAPVIGLFVTLVDVNMDGYVGSLGKGSIASGMFSRIQLLSGLVVLVLSFVLGVLAVSYSGSWRWFFYLMAALSVLTVLVSARDYPRGSARPGALRELLPHFKEGLSLLRTRKFLCVVATGTFGTCTLVAVATDAPYVLSDQIKSSAWTYGGIFGLISLMSVIGSFLGMRISKRIQPARQLVIGALIMAVTSAGMLLASLFFPGNGIAIGIPMAMTYVGHSILTGAALAAAVDLSGNHANIGPSMLTLFKRLIPLLVSAFIVVLTMTGKHSGAMTMSIIVLVTSALALLSAIGCVWIRIDPVVARS